MQIFFPPPEGPEVDLGVPPAAVQSAREEVFEKSCFFLGEEKMAPSDGKCGNMSRFFLDTLFVGAKNRAVYIWVMVDLYIRNSEKRWMK